MQRMLLSVTALAGAILGVVQVVSLAAGTHALKTWAQAFFVFGDLVALLIIAAVAWSSWRGSTAHSSPFSRIYRLITSAIAAGVCAVLLVLLLRSDGSTGLTTAKGIAFGVLIVTGLPILVSEIAEARRRQAGAWTTCPYCREKIRRDAARCKHCQADLSKVESPRILLPPDYR